MTCGKKLVWYELFPIFSFLFLRGRCAGCQSKISWQYPLVEFSTAVLFTLSAWHFWPAIPLIVLYWLITAILVAIVAYDLRHQIIPDGFVFTLLAVVLVGFIGLQFFSSGFSLLWLWSLIWPGLVPFAIFGSIWLFSGGRAMGFGDAKLALPLGIVLGFKDMLNMLISAFWLGAVLGLLLIIAGRLGWLKGRYGAKTALPFAPFLVLGFYLVLFGVLDFLAFWPAGF